MSRLELTVRARDRGAEITVLDHSFAEVARGARQIVAALDDGLYKIRVAAGDRQVEQFVSIDGDDVRLLEADHPARAPASPPALERRAGGATVTMPALRFASPAPLSSTARTHESHIDLAQKVSRGPAIDCGTGATLLLVARCWSPGGRTALPGHPAEGLTLHAASGQPILDFATAVVPVDLDGDPIAAAKVSLAPGGYRLRAGAGAAAREQALWLPPGWDLHVFLLVGERQQRQTAILMSRGPFRYDDDDLRLAEIARLALARGRALSGADLHRMLEGKFDNPMLGLFAGHRLLLDRERDVAVLAEVTDNLGWLVGRDHPDVAALRFAFDRVPPPAGAFRFPPMLARSWELALQASALAPAVMPADSLSAQLAGRRFADPSWLLWRPPTERVMRFDTLESVAPPLGPAERRLLELLARQHGVPLRPEDADLIDDGGREDDDLPLELVVRAMGAPAAAVGLAATRILDEATLEVRQHPRWVRLERNLTLLAKAAPAAASTPTAPPSPALSR